MAQDDDVLEKAKRWLDEGRAVALATVVETWGSSPRPRGSQLAVRDDGLFVGSVSGGCVEGRVVLAAQESMADRAHRLLEFGVSDDEAWEVGLACGGTVRIYVAPIESPGKPAPISRAVLDDVLAARAERRGIVVATPLDGRPVRSFAPDAVPQDLANDSTFVQSIDPSLELVIIGAVHIAEPLVQIASLLGYAVTIIDPREAFARAERWPGMNVSTDYPDEVMTTMKIGHRTAVVALTHDPKIDDPALEIALRSRAFYIGALGSKKTHATRLARLAERGFSNEMLALIHGPIGLRIGARSPAEIAVSIAAEMTESLRVVKEPK